MERGSPATTRRCGVAATTPRRDAGAERASADSRSALVALGVGRDHVDVDVVRCSEHVGDHRTTQQVRPARLTARPQHDLGRVLGPCELHQRAGRVGAGQLVVLTAELLQERALHAEGVARAGPQTVGRRARGLRAADSRARAAMPCRSADHVVAAGRAGDGDDDPLPRLPGTSDAVRLAVRRPAPRRPGRRPT